MESQILNYKDLAALPRVKAIYERQPDLIASAQQPHHRYMSEDDRLDTYSYGEVLLPTHPTAPRRWAADSCCCCCCCCYRCWLEVVGVAFRGGKTTRNPLTHLCVWLSCCVTFWCVLGVMLFVNLSLCFLQCHILVKVKPTNLILTFCICVMFIKKTKLLSYLQIPPGCGVV